MLQGLWVALPKNLESFSGKGSRIESVNRLCLAAEDHAGASCRVYWAQCLTGCLRYFL